MIEFKLGVGGMQEHEGRKGQLKVGKTVPVELLIARVRCMGM